MEHLNPKSPDEMREERLACWQALPTPTMA
jgi:hypothetical protein